jgi:hypothetical protein
MVRELELRIVAQSSKISSSICARFNFFQHPTAACALPAPRPASIDAVAALREDRAVQTC